MELISLKDSAARITEISGVPIDRRAMWHALKRGLFKAERVGKSWYILDKDVEDFAKDFKGFRIGRPPNNENN